MVTPDDIVAYARTWLGARWRHQGRGHGPQRGIDCAGLVIRVAQHFDLPWADLPGYGRQPDPKFLQHVKDVTDPGSVNNPHGTVAVFSDSILPCHLGILSLDRESGRVDVIHSEAFPAMRCRISTLDSMRRRLVTVRQFRGVSYE